MRGMGGIRTGKPLSGFGMLSDMAQNDMSPALTWLLEYLGDSET